MGSLSQPQPPLECVEKEGARVNMCVWRSFNLIASGLWFYGYNELATMVC
jgi:hypothetical protein